ncbi:1-phosphofructokinase family hexose kinase [Herbiconiux sp. L3-i23]|uniref:1-phosphofructokinase family hexose kinase n=1 Tax=Herbiconiux sp. L3-i23 TaxID=2905871 RepID=UPI00207415D7|nr:PfkB family carbohydrate kinase [Herbiconiux sp. L3-i23]
MTRVAVFAPSPVLTVTIEDHPTGPDVHVHAGGQGVWQARMLERLGVETTICAVLTGEVGGLVRHLADDEGIEVLGVERDGRGAAYVHDRREGERESIVEAAGDPLSRHELDELYGLTLHAGLECDAIILSGPTSDDEIPAEVYRRLAADLRAAGRRVIADLSGDRLEEALGGGLLLVKVSDSELRDSGRLDGEDRADIVAAMQRIRDDGAEHVIVTRAHESTLVASPDGVREVHMPEMQVVDTRGAGDSLTAGVTSVLARGGDIDEALEVGSAAGALNVTRHGLGSSQPEAVRSMMKLVRIDRLEEFEGKVRG